MDMNEKFPSGALKLKEVQAEEKAQKNVDINQSRVKRVVSGPVKVKKNFGREFKESFMSEDAGEVKSYILTEVIIPGLKDLIITMATSAINMIFYGESRPYNRSGSRGSLFDYNGISSRKASGIHNIYDHNYRRDERPYSRSYNDFILPTRRDAEEVLMLMNDTIARYGTCRVADLYEAVGADSHNYTDYNFGWKSLAEARITSARGGWRIDLPRPQAI